MKRRTTQNGVLVEIEATCAEEQAAVDAYAQTMRELIEAQLFIPRNLFRHDPARTATAVRMQQEDVAERLKRFHTPPKKDSIDMVQDRDGRFVPRGHEDDCRKLR